MEVKRIKCPSCGIILEVRNPKDEAVKIIKCPKCKATLSVKFKKQPLEAHTFLASNKPQNGETQYGGFNKAGETQLGGSWGQGETQIGTKPVQSKSPCLKVNGRTYQLSIGTNIVGRKAPTSRATLQIATPDRYMSRQHSRIVVSKLPNGKLKAVISNEHNKNITNIDGQDLQQGDAIVLTDGDSIIMGETTVTYKEL